MAIFGRKSARQRLRRATEESLEFSTFSSHVDCTPWVVGGLWPAELSVRTPQNATLAEYLTADLDQISQSANHDLKMVGRSGLTDSAREAAEARVIREARARAEQRVESTVRQLQKATAGFARGELSRKFAEGFARRDLEKGSEKTTEMTVVLPRMGPPAPPDGKTAEKPPVNEARTRPRPANEGPSSTEPEMPTAPIAKVTPADEQARRAAEPAKPTSGPAEMQSAPEQPRRVPRPAAFLPAPPADEGGLAEPWLFRPPEPDAPPAPEVAEAVPVVERPQPPAPKPAPPAQAGFAGQWLFRPPEPATAPTAPIAAVGHVDERPVPPADREVAPEDAKPAPPAQAETADERLQRLLAFAARQEPRMNWAVADRADGTTILVTDLAHGWIPRGIELPAGVRLLEPERRTGGIAAMIGETIRSATYRPGDAFGWLVEFPATETSMASRELPKIDDLGWDLSAATHWRDGLPRMVHTLARAAAAGTGVVDAEAELLRVYLDTARYRLLEQNPNPELPLLLNCLLLAATDSLVSGDRLSANYHLTWFQKLNAPAASRWTEGSGDKG